MSKTGIERIAEERRRQIETFSYDSKHDGEHYLGELAIAAACYAGQAAGIRIYQHLEVDKANYEGHYFVDPWPFKDADNRRMIESTADEIRCLEKAGALIAAEIDRILENER